MPNAQPLRDDWERTVRSGAWFAALPVEFATALLADARPLVLASGQRLFARGDAPDGIYCVLRGVVRITGITQGGHEALLAMLEAPQWFGEIALFDGAPRTHDAWAEGECELLRIPQESVLNAVARLPQGWRELGRLLTQKLRMTFLAVEEITLLPATPRVAARLITIASGYGTWSDRSKRIIGVSQEQLGLMLSLSRQTVNQSLRELEVLGAIQRNRGAIEILDIEKLRQAREHAA
ncbi:Crp/Fnr family transcriptional regulator [Dyella terrae]|uniref:Crp/Fnr family transcriptional regulator n=1 Tax=Dyella terrae TaxID=522259 RepID=UPI001EFDE600|nr:Crp/Fnr family transcriptional regulator [Dyella terrae]ULU23891.1 Crp/Fnr family transcriptional regulator [Dyella terrae]